MIANVLEYLERTARRLPDKAALIDERGTLTYAQLFDLSRRIGTALSSRVSARGAVAVLMDARDARCVPAFLGILCAGCCYVPLDGAMPTERLRLILGQLQPALLLHDDKTADAVRKLEDAYPALQYEAAASGGIDEGKLAAIRAQSSVYDLQSILYTSGSTGIPKGVAQSQYSYITYTEATIEKFSFTQDDVFGNQSPFFYANSIIDIYPPLALGATTYILPAKCLTFPKALVEHLNLGGVTELTMTPSSYVAVANAGVLAPGCLPRLKYIILSGEAAHGPTLRRWMAAAPNAGVWNFYGSTEAFSVAVWRLDREIDDGEVLPVGAPYNGVHIVFVDEDGRELPRGERGDMLIANPWLSSGYYRDARRTGDAFVADPLGRGYHERFYRTGDVGFLNAQGQLVVLGRRDSQIKRAGYRMELGEVEYALRAIPSWKDGCCLYDRQSEKLACFWEGELTREVIARALKEKLPRYALPDTYIHLDAMPHTASMKIDRERLKALLGSA